ncbi:MAG: hypothetical protein P4L31_05075 [Candidatus Babeliales bacterium]|nr:hypothetical protein [Candidatus Babeliales bacterium]
MNQNIFKKTYIILLTFLICIGFSSTALKAYNIGLLVVATGRYTDFVQPLLDSANKYFCTNHKVTYFIFTDGQIPQADNIVRVEQNRLGWPYDTMMRFDMYAQHKDLYASMDYLFACDADMLFVDTVGDEILGDLVGTLHPGFVGTKGTYERRSESTACIKRHTGKCYFAGGFNGGARESYIKMAETISQNIKIDQANGIMAIWHDESHLNRYFVTNEPSIVLSPSYCYWEGKTLPYQQRLVALNKNHAEYRAD